MSVTSSWYAKIALFSLLGLLLISHAGCVGLGAQLIYWAKGGDRIDAEFSGLEEKRVAIVCVANSSAYGPHTISGMLERAVATVLRQKGREIEVVHQDEVADWIDNNDWDQMDYREIGRGVDADMVVGIDLDGVRLHEGQTLYRGRASVAVKAFDMREGEKLVFHKDVPDFAFPRNGPRHATEMSESRFRNLFVMVLAQEVAKYFHDYNIEEDFATDAMLMGG